MLDRKSELYLFCGTFQGWAMRLRPLNNTDLGGYARRSIDRRATAARDALPGSRRFQWDSLLLLAPSAGLLGLLFVFPIGYAVYLGFTNLQLVGINAAAVMISSALSGALRR